MNRTKCFNPQYLILIYLIDFKKQKDLHQGDENIEFEGKANEQSLALDILSFLFREILIKKIFLERVWIRSILH